MANNSIELITKYSTDAWDKVYKKESIISLLDRPNAQVKWTGAKTVKIAKINLTGLGNYYRPNDQVDNAAGDNGFGYAQGNMGLTWEEFTIDNDRGQKIPVELFDDEETDGIAIGAATAELSRTVMIPEVDAFGFSKIASYASEELGNLVLGEVTKENSIELLNDAFLYFDNHEVPAENQIIFASPKFMNAIRNNTTSLNRYLRQEDYSKDVKFTLTTYEGRPFAVVPPARFRTELQFKARGYSWGENSKDINFMVVAKDVIIHVVKYNKVKVISGDLNLAGQNFDGSTIYARIYHDLFVMDNKRYGLYVHLDEASAKAPEINVSVKFEEGTRKVASIEAVSKELSVAGIKYTFYTTTDNLEVGATLPATANELKVVKKGSTIEAGTTVYAVESIDGHIVAKTAIE